MSFFWYNIDGDIMVKATYIHIPFCDSICSYCDFCKIYYDQNFVKPYLENLEQEVKKNYKGEVLDTLYIGGGTPSCLSLLELKTLFEIIKIFKLSKDYEFTFECNIENISEEKLKFLYKNKVNRLSIGVQTFNQKHLKILRRNHISEETKEKVDLIKKIGFKNINVDLIYGIPNQTLKDVEEDINNFIALDINHISTYSLIIEKHTRLYVDKVQNIDEELDYNMYQLIEKKLKEKGFIHYEISNFARKGYESRHNLTYWNNENYYGFGAGSSGYIENIRYDNTRSLTNYNKGKYLFNSDVLSDNEILQNEFILGFRKIKGINIEKFNNKFNFDINQLEIIKNLIKERKLITDGVNIYINPKYIYLSNQILVQFLE